MQKEKTFSVTSIEKIYDRHGVEWKLPFSMNKKRFIDGLVKQKICNEIDLLGIDNSVKKLYSFDNASTYDIINSINRNGYFTHYTALYYHELTLQIPKIYYLNTEHFAIQGTLSENAVLSQSSIDKAFASDQRKSLNEYSWNNFRVILLRGKSTRSLGVLTVINEQGTFKITDVERTLIDAVVRPVYCGGVTDVLAAFEAAKRIVDIDKLVNYLKKLNYSYPYHQAIGFYLEKASYPSESIKKFSSMRKEFDFYLTYNIRRKEYSEKWKLYYPKGL